MVTRPYPSRQLHGAKEVVTPDLPQKAEQLLWCTTCGIEVVEPAAHICNTPEEPVSNA